MTEKTETILSEIQIEVERWQRTQNTVYLSSVGWLPLTLLIKTKNRLGLLCLLIPNSPLPPSVKAIRNDDALCYSAFSFDSSQEFQTCIKT